jgi:membrane protein CcdC involved in cytochrome C biogenesis
MENEKPTEGKILNNVSVQKHPITTIPGLGFISLGFLMYALPMFMTVKKDFTEQWYIPLMVVILGVILIFSPDTLVKAGDKAIDKGEDLIGKK